VTEAEAQTWLEAELGVPRETITRLALLAELVLKANRTQNLVSATSLVSIWSRHIADSAQLLRYCDQTGSWADLGSGAGFPGLVIAAIRGGKITLIESRRLRAEFLRQSASTMEVETEILEARAERIRGRTFDIISARAFAPLDKLFRAAWRLSRADTVWLLPKGRSAKSELEAARASWQGDFRIEPSATDPDAGIIIARGVRPIGKRS